MFNNANNLALYQRLNTKS